jgi:probable rRNA maturation factor
MTATIIEIDISRHCSGWPDINECLENAIHKALHGAGHNKPSEISLVLADDAFVQSLNKTYRNKDKPTNVLSFQQEPDSAPHLGDIIMALETIQNEARAQNKSFNDHATHLTVHGTLHLLGFDHESDEEAEEMEALEVEILQNLGIKNPYET